MAVPTTASVPATDSTRIGEDDVVLGLRNQASLGYRDCPTNCRTTDLPPAAKTQVKAHSIGTSLGSSGIEVDYDSLVFTLSHVRGSQKVFPTSDLSKKQQFVY